MKINLFAVNISALLNSPIDDWLKYFSVERREKILSYRFNADRNRTVWSELLVRCVVSEKFSCPIEKVKVNRDTKGKPHIEELPVEISLSHAGNWVVCSIGAHSSGVDVEVDSTAALEIAKNFFLPKEFGLTLKPGNGTKNYFFARKSARATVFDILDNQGELF